MKFVRINAFYLDQTSNLINEDKFTILAPLDNHRLVTGRWFGEWKREYDVFPFVLDKDCSEFNFGSCDTDLWPTNIGKKEIQVGNFFTVWIDNGEHVYRIESIHEY